jgi:hypothetical protein
MEGLLRVPIVEIFSIVYPPWEVVLELEEGAKEDKESTEEEEELIMLLLSRSVGLLVPD